MFENASSIIREKRIEQKLSQAKLAQKAGLCENTIYNLENGKYKTQNISTFIKVCTALGLEIKDIV